MEGEEKGRRGERRGINKGEGGREVARSMGDRGGVYWLRGRGLGVLGPWA